MHAPFSSPDPFDEDPVWRLLDQAPLTAPHDWLATQTLARCRREFGLGAADQKSFLAPAWWRLTFGGLLSAGVALVVVLAPMPAPTPAPTEKADVQQALDYMASLSTEKDSSSWSEPSSL